MRLFSVFCFLFLFTTCFSSSDRPSTLFFSCSLPFTYPSPQASHSSTLTPRNYTNSLSGRQCEWRDGGQGGKDIVKENLPLFDHPTTHQLNACFCTFSAPVRYKRCYSDGKKKQKNHPVRSGQNVFTLRHGPNPAVEMNRITLMWI